MSYRLKPLRGVVEKSIQVNFYGFTPIAFATTGFACPPLTVNFFYRFTPVRIAAEY
jgi:hypothetical protein